ncbi:MAG: thioredoxin-disulfide reductase [Deltaproteobacteria bacterium]|nr:thioredoxin-disulfide reductase [Deltaproteobacteria bacterium]
MHKVVIIGSGPAGLTAAIYTGRAQLKPVVFEGGFLSSGELMTSGGQLMITTEVENYPGFPDGVTGPELVERTRAQAEKFGADLRQDVIDEVDFTGFPLRLKTGEGQWLEAATVIIATGANAKWLGIPSEQTYLNRGVSACATCDGAFYKEVPVYVVGGGDTALEEAQFLTRYASHVTLVHRRDAFRASKIMAERALKHPKISVEWNAVVDEILGDGKKCTGLRLKSTVDGSTKEVAAGGLFVAIGHQPNTSVFQGQLELRPDGYIATKGFTATSATGVFAAGDVADSRYRQAITAAGMGCMAAIDAERLVEEYEARGLLSH